ncbi:FecCD family ABC transporter permease [Thermocoleostomius sinensis]|uniref:Iron ABC transporter permease n=1 Tax=Thermocoleostomius sinensis A174 TaxID=2016057 RepID=A0A9E8ZA14_9CYAN|nr:iron ABC transporter permease [Thermocoleostomius sinensis]WAL58047.1 iron ABC transporter permease [Thermocoleostomius sinensis A174]
MTLFLHQAKTTFRRSHALRLSGLVIGLCLLLICLVLSITLGAADLSLPTIWQALVAFDGSTDHLIITTVRLPRSLIAMTVGGALAVAGAITQGLTRNPLAAPDIIGINTGAALAVVAVTFWWGSASTNTYVWAAFLGGTIAAVVVYWLGSVGRGGLTPLKLILAGAALSYLLSSITTGILILSQRTLDEIRFWLAGSVAGRDIDTLLMVLPYILLGLAIALGLSRQITALTLGEEVAKGLGIRTVWVEALATVVVILLAGSSVALAGPIGFIGLIIPHVSRFFVGVDYRWLLPYAAIGGAILLLLADVGARIVVRPQELPVGIMTALIGAPFFIYLARRKVKG